MYKYFHNIRTAEEAKARYRELCREYHPDISSNPDANRIMAEINAEWERVWPRYKDIHQTAEGKTYTETREDRKSTETAGEFAGIIARLVVLTGITVELVGCWIWVSGNTFPHRDTLKALGFQWASKKRMWAYHKEPYERHSKKEIPMDEIKAKYGCTRYASAEQLKLA